MNGNAKKKCNHQWINAGLWDGRTQDGKPTGGHMYSCSLCKEKAFSMEEIKKKGGTYNSNTDLYGRPKK